MNKNWSKITRDLLNNAPRTLTLQEVSDATGLQVSWLSSFAHNKIKNPGINNVQKLHDFLTKDKG